MVKPTLVITHGSWHSPEHFGPLIADLEGHGYRCVPVPLPSTQSADLPPASLSDDTAAVRNAVTAELNRNNDVVVVAHSYGGAPACNALKGLDRKSRTTDGATTAVVAIALLCAIIAAPGTSFIGNLGGEPWPIHDKRTDDFAWVGKPGPSHYFYNDLPAAEADKWSALLRPQSWAAYTGKVTNAAYMEIPTTFLFCQQDHAFPYEAQKGMIAAVVEAGGKIVGTETFDSSHSPFLSMTKQTSEFIRKAASG